MKRSRLLVILVVCAATANLTAAPSKGLVLKYHDGKADGKKSIAGSGEMIMFTLPTGKEKVTAIKIHGSRYGYPKAPKEDFIMHFLNEDASEVIHKEKVAYSKFKRGEDKWVEIKLKKKLKVPASFWVVLQFNAERTKGVYVSYDASTKGKYSKVGLPGEESAQTAFGGDWMIEAILSRF